jgi:hypothetical protein
VSYVKMKWSREYIAPVAITMLVIAAGGCQTTPRTQNHPAPSSDRQPPSSPLLERGDYPERLGVVMRDALAAHKFTLPWVIVRGSDASFWFVADRFESPHRFDRASVQVAADGRVTACITPYRFGPSDWAILGRAFIDTRPEAELLAKELTLRLDRDKQAAKP